MRAFIIVSKQPGMGPATIIAAGPHALTEVFATEGGEDLGVPLRAVGAQGLITPVPQPPLGLSIWIGELGWSGFDAGLPLAEFWRADFDGEDDAPAVLLGVQPVPSASAPFMWMPLGNGNTSVLAALLAGDVITLPCAP